LNDFIQWQSFKSLWKMLVALIFLCVPFSCRKVRREWQEDQWADQRKEKEEAAARYRRKQEERQRQKEELVKRKKEKDQEKIDGAKGESR